MTRCATMCCATIQCAKICYDTLRQLASMKRCARTRYMRNDELQRRTATTHRNNALHPNSRSSAALLPPSRYFPVASFSGMATFSLSLLPTPTPTLTPTFTSSYPYLFPASFLFFIFLLSLPPTSTVHFVERQINWRKL